MSLGSKFVAGLSGQARNVYLTRYPGDYALQGVSTKGRINDVSNLSGLGYIFLVLT